MGRANQTFAVLALAFVFFATIKGSLRGYLQVLGLVPE